MTKPQEVTIEINEEQADQLPEKMPCPGCSNFVYYPNYHCTICNKQIVFAYKQKKYDK